MSAAAPVRPLRRPFEVHSAPVAWTTPTLLRLGVYGVVGASLLFMIAVVTGAQGHRRAMQSIGKNAAAGIVAAQHMRSAMADMDASAAQELLSANNQQAHSDFEAYRLEAVSSLVAAAENIANGNAERIPITKLAFDLGSYTAQMQSARDLVSAGDNRFLDAYRAAADTLDKRLLPTAETLDKANRNLIDDTYARQNVSSSASLLFVLLSSLLVCGLLVALQVFLARRMRRLVNPLLVAATVIAVIFTMSTVGAFQAEDRELKVAKEDAFDSIHLLWQSLALAYNAKSDEVRFLLEPDRSGSPDEKAFLEKADRIAHFPEGQGSVDATSGYLTDELKNVTFPGEREAATESLARFHDYLAVDRQMRNLVKAGKRKEAIDLETGAGQGQAKQAFNQFDDALGRALTINVKYFREAVDRGLKDVTGFEITAPIAAFLIAVLAFLGLLPRIREYSS